MGRVRIGWHDHVLDTFLLRAGLRRSGPASAPEDPEQQRLAWLTRSILLTEAMAPSLYQAAREVAGRLGVSEPLELYQSADAGAWRTCRHSNMMIGLSRSPIRVRIVGSVATDLGLFKVA